MNSQEQIDGLEMEVSRLEEALSEAERTNYYFQDEIAGLEITNQELELERDTYKEALEAILAVDSPGSLVAALEIAREALVEGQDGR